VPLFVNAMPATWASAVLLMVSLGDAFESTRSPLRFPVVATSPAIDTAPENVPVVAPVSAPPTFTPAKVAAAFCSASCRVVPVVRTKQPAAVDHTSPLTGADGAAPCGNRSPAPAALEAAVTAGAPKVAAPVAAAKVSASIQLAPSAETLRWRLSSPVSPSSARPEKLVWNRWEALFAAFSFESLT
jgi:hypothetical protein